MGEQGAEVAIHIDIDANALVEQVRRDMAQAEALNITRTTPRPGKIGCEATRFEIDEGRYLWAARHGDLDVAQIITSARLLHAEIRQEGMLVLVDDAGNVYAVAF